MLSALDKGLRLSVPGLLLIAAILAAALPTYLPNVGQVAPALALPVIFYWMVYRPSVLPAPMVFLVGFLRDAVHGFPFGTSAIVFLLTIAVVLPQRPILLGLPFWVLWLAFALTAAIVGGIEWAILTVAVETPLPVTPSIFSWFVVVGTYPLGAWVMMAIHRSLVGDESEVNEAG